MIEDGAPIVERYPHAWSGDYDSKNHCCYFCHPACFPPMAEHQTLCCRCGNLIQLDHSDPMNLEMEACVDCIEELREEFESSSIKPTKERG